MAYTGHIADTETGRRAAGSALWAQNPNSVSTSSWYQVAAASLSSVAVAQAAVASQAAGNTANVNIHVSDRQWATSMARGYQIASNVGGTACMTGSSYSVLYAALPDSVGHTRNMIQS